MTTKSKSYRHSGIATCDRYLTIRCKAFANEGIREHRIMVCADTVDGREVTRGNVLVWDSVAGHFTSCHSLSPKTIARIRSTFQP